MLKITIIDDQYIRIVLIAFDLIRISQLVVHYDRFSART